MKNRFQVSVFAGVFVVSGVALSMSQAMAFGQQWRPAAPVYQTQQAPQAGFRRVANVPSFRPRGAKSQPRFTTGVQGGHRGGQAYRAPRPYYAGVQTGLPRTRPAEWMRGPVYAQGPMPPAVNAYGPGSPWGMPMWANPFAQMAQGWQYAMPTFPRQFAWQPAASERGMVPPARVDRRYSARPTAYRQAGRLAVANAPRGALPSWRPNAAATGYNTLSASPRGYRPVGLARPGYPAAIARVGVPQAAGQNWRPADVSVAGRWNGNGFRPAGYGRNLAAVADNARNSAIGVTLPGWVSTQKDPLELSCDWCNGS